MKNFEVRSKRYVLVVFFMVVILSLLNFQQTVTADEERSYENKVLGVKFDNKQGFQIYEREFIRDVLGFTIFENIIGSAHNLTKLQIDWRFDESHDSLVELIESEMNRYPELHTQMRIIQVGGVEGAALYPMPGIELSTNIYIVANERLYEIRHPGEVDEEVIQLLSEISFVEPSEKFVKSNYPLEKDNIFIDPSEVPRTEYSSEDDISNEPNSHGRSTIMGANNDGHFVNRQYSDFEYTNSLKTNTPVSGCTNYWGYSQTQWNAWANSNSGESWAGSSFWGQNLHQGCNDNYSYNDHYALDHSLNLWDSVYPHRSGTVVFADAMGGNWSSLGLTVIIDYGGNIYGVMSHLHYISSNASVGNWVSAGTAVGYAGKTGGQSAVHLHQSIQKGGVIQSNPNGIKGGQSARPYLITHNGGQYYWYNMSVGMTMQSKP